MIRVEVHPEAQSELDEAYAWYRERSELIATVFLIEIDQAITKIAQRPEAWPQTRANEHRFILNKFPFSVIYRVRNRDVYVTAFAHHRRRPNYWLNRDPFN